VQAATYHEYFLEAQGYTLKEKVFYQDKQSTIRLEKNGHKSWPNSRPINIRCFSIQNIIGLANIHLQYCPTKQMLADFFTKPFQGKLFQKFRDIIMGHEHINSLKETMPTSSQEQLEKVSLPANKWNGAVGQKIDLSILERLKRTCQNQ
jgi:hypothetical protein